MRIFSRYFLSIFFLVTLTLLLVAAVLFLNARQIMNEMGTTSAATMNTAFARQVEEQGRNLAGVIAESVITPIMLREYVAMQDILTAAKVQQQIEFAYVYDDLGRILHDGTATMVERGKSITDIVSVVDLFQTQVIWARDKNLMYCLAPIMIQDKVLGGVCIGMSLGNINQSVAGLQAELAKIQQLAISKNIKVLSVVAFIVLVVSLITTFLLARHLAMPIRELASFVGRMGLKDDEPLLSESRSDEVGMLARELGQLARHLQETTVSRDHFRGVLNSMPDGVLVTDADGLIVTHNHSVSELLRVPEEALIGKHISKVLPLSRSGVNLEGLRVDTAQVGFEVSLDNGKRKIPCLASASLVVNKSDETEGSVFVLHDITELKESERVIASQKERLDVTLRSIGDGVITTDIHGRVVLMNRMAEKMTGYSQDNGHGKPLTEVFRIKGEEGSRPYPSPVDAVLTNGKVVLLEEDTVLETREGRELNVSDSCSPIRDEDGNIVGAVLVFSDITEKKKLLQESQKAEKLEALGMLAGGIAHDFNNILTAILGNLSFLRIKYSIEQGALDKLSLAEKATLKAKSLTQQLLTFAKGGAPITKTMPIKDLITETTQFCLQGSHVKAEFDISESLWPVIIDTGQISQVLNNLVFNALQAMQDGGVVFITARNMDVALRNKVHLEPGRYVRIEVSDQGVGIPQHMLPKIFDPYFTTKDTGYGLGLATTYSIISKHKGHISIDTEEGKGTTATFYLPASTDLPEQSSEEEGDIAAAGGNGNILLMDDDPLVRDITTEFLSFLGYTTTSVEDGREAIELYKTARQDGNPFDAVIMDLTIPGGMGGKEAIKELIAIDPQVKAIVASGYSNDPIMAQYEKYGFKGMIVKPYKIESMQELLRRVLTNGNVRQNGDNTADSKETGTGGERASI